jgi:hypothetical protein
VVTRNECAIVDDVGIFFVCGHLGGFRFFHQFFSFLFHMTWAIDMYAFDLQTQMDARK